MTHKIRLLGPWTLILQGTQVEAKRTFHAPSGIRNGDQPLTLLRWKGPPDFPVQMIRLNGEEFLTEVGELSPEHQPKFFSIDTGEGVGTFNATGILRAFNEWRLVWTSWPKSTTLTAGRYTPSSDHPLHNDAWLEIHAD